MSKFARPLSRFLGISVLLLMGSTPALAELSAEHKHRVRGEMREMWSRMTPEERETLRREYAAPRLEEAPGMDGVKPPQRPVDRQRQFSSEDHYHLRRQLRDISQEGRN